MHQTFYLPLKSSSFSPPFYMLHRMKTFNFVSPLSDPKSRLCFYSLFVTVSLICGVFFIGTAFLGKDFRMPQRSKIDMNGTRQGTHCNECKNKCRPLGSEALPEGIVAKTSNLEMRPLWGPVKKDDNEKESPNLLAIAVGIKQKAVVSEIIKKFLANEFTVMLFHYDGFVDEWRDLAWNGSVIHVSAFNQTKWWFAKRFLHPDIVAEYNYIFLWDEDLRVNNFHPLRYISIIKSEGLEISQPALDPANSEIHHLITARRSRSRVHRRIYKFKGNEKCDEKSTAPPCVGWVEMMAPVFSRAAWRCAWYMIQNDLIHAWGVDIQLGYCAQGDRMRNVGVVDSEYIVHLGLPTLGASDESKLKQVGRNCSRTKNLAESETLGIIDFSEIDNRAAVRIQSNNEMKIFKKRWITAVKEDKCWTDPFLNGSSKS